MERAESVFGARMTPGTKVRLSAMARARMGLLKGRDDTWTVVECTQLEFSGEPCLLCSRGTHVYVNVGRHVAVAALNVRGAEWPLENQLEDTCQQGKGYTKTERKRIAKQKQA